MSTTTRNPKLLLAALAVCVFLSVFTRAEKSEAFVVDSLVNRIPVGAVLDADFVMMALRCFSPNPTIYGTTQGTVYCIKNLIYTTVKVYTNYMNSIGFVRDYQGVCYVTALTFLGIRIMALQSDQIAKDIIKILFKLGVSIFLITQAPNIFLTITSAIGEGIGWVTGLFALIVPPSSCMMISWTPSFLQAVDGSVNIAEYNIWHQVDCILLRLFGITVSVPQPPTAFIKTLIAPFGIAWDPAVIWAPIWGAFSAWVTATFGFTPDTAHLEVFSASMVMLLMLAAATGTVGLILLFIGLTFIFMVLKTILRALFIVLSSYMMLGVVAILMPLFAPLIVFESHREDSYTRAIFDKFVMLLFSSFLQPVIMVAYLCFMTVCMDAFIEGENSPDPNIAAAFAGCTPGKEGGKICSFNKLFPTTAQAIGNLVSTTVGDSVAMNSDYAYITDLNRTLAQWTQLADPQSTSANCNQQDPIKNGTTSDVVGPTSPLTSTAPEVKVPGPAALKVSYMYLEQFMLLLIAAILVMMSLAHLLNTLPQMIANIVQVGGGIASAAAGLSAPLEGLMNDAKTDVIKGLKSGKSATDIVGNMKGGMQGLAKSIANRMVGKR